MQLPRSHRPSAIVIGSGFGGLAAAIRLQARGYGVTLLEALDRPGGRGRVFHQDGFTFDAGPTILTAPFLVDELFALSGRNTADYVRIVPTHPAYRIQFHDGKVFNYEAEAEAIEAEVQRFDPSELAGYRRFAEHAEAILERAFVELADQPFSSLSDMLRVFPDLMRLRADRSVAQAVGKHLKNEQLRQVFSFHPLLVGGNPFSSSSIYAMIHALEKRWGVHFVLGGTGALVQALLQLFQEMGGRFHLNARVERILCTAGDASTQGKPRATGVQLADGTQWASDVVVSNADVANTYRQMVAPEFRSKWTDRRLERLRYSMGLFVIYFGTNRTYPNLAHHTIILGPRYKDLLADIFDHKVLAPDFSLYLHAPTRTDPSLAPAGHECFYVLSPVPNLRGNIDWHREKDRYADAILASLEIPSLCPNLRKHIVTRRILSPIEFEQDYGAYAGSAFQFEPILTQSAWFRPHNQSEDIAGLYFASAGTHPGAGVPGVLCSAKVLDRLIPPVRPI